VISPAPPIRLLRDVAITVCDRITEFHAGDGDPHALIEWLGDIGYALNYDDPSFAERWDEITSLEEQGQISREVADRRRRRLVLEEGVKKGHFDRMPIPVDVSEIQVPPRVVAEEAPDG
jgi:hypothetical protein